MSKCKQCGWPGIKTKFCSERCKWTWHNRNRTLKPNEVGLCAICSASISRWVSPARRKATKDDRLFCNRTCAGVGRMGERHPMWNGGRCVDPDGYVSIYSPDHPRATSKGYVYEHRLVMERKIGRYLTADEVVHHRNDNPSDNRIRNLKLYPNNAAHKADDAKRRERDRAGRLKKKGTR